MTIEENLRESAVLFDLPAATAAGRIEEALRGAGLTERRRALVKRLSGGLQRRVDLCRALLHEPAILLLDEPTTGLDPRARAAFFETLDAEQTRRSLTIVMTTHVLDEAEHSDRVLLMHEGRLIADGAPGSLRSELGAHQITVTDGAWRPAAEDAARWSSTSAGLVCRAADDELPPLAADLARRGVAFRLAPPTLADVFEAHTGAALDGDASPPVLGEASP